MISRPLLFAICLASAIPGAALAQTACFCLQNPATLTIERRGCEARIIPNRISERVTCQTVDFTGLEAMDNPKDFARIAGGEGQCTPCFASPVDQPDDSVRSVDDSDGASGAPAEEISQ